MIPTTTNNQFIIPNESQSMQVPKIDHILAHASNPELSYIYARPELQASAAVNSQDGTTLSRTDSQTPKKGRPAKDKKNLDGTDKKAGVKPRKPDPYDKYYLDNTKPAKKAPPKKVENYFLEKFYLKKVDLWSQEAWEDILNRKRKYFEFLKLTGELNDERSDDDGGQEDFEFKQEEEDEFPHYEGEHEEAHHQGGYEQNFEVEDEQGEEQEQEQGENIHQEHEEENNNHHNIDSHGQIEIEEPGEVEEEFEQKEPETHESNQLSDKIGEASEGDGNFQEEQE